MPTKPQSTTTAPLPGLDETPDLARFVASGADPALDRLAHAYRVVSLEFSGVAARVDAATGRVARADVALTTATGAERRRTAARLAWHERQQADAKARSVHQRAD